MNLKFGPIRQIGYVVRDVAKALRHWTEVIGVGPFFLLEGIKAEGFHYRGEPSPLVMSMAFGQSGPLQIELIQPLNQAPSLFRDFLEAGDEGQHHLAFWTTNFDRDIEWSREAGLSIVQSAAPGGVGNRNVFFSVHDHPGTLIELSEISGRKGAFFRMIAECADNWDGTDPIRRVQRMAPPGTSE
jgi:catechol 2,3-dioxygenase-like lactoylglutathione lyase family enzyme